MKRVVLATVVVVVTMAALATPTSAAVTPPEDPIELTVVAAAGPGCLPGTYELTPLAGNEGFRVTYRDFRSSVGKGAPPTDFRKACQLSIQVRGVPSKYSYRIAAVDSRGTADIAAGARGNYRSLASFDGGPPALLGSHDLPGGFAGSWQYTDDDFVWVGCGHPAVITAIGELRTLRGTSDPILSFLALESATYRLGWGLCVA